VEVVVLIGTVVVGTTGTVVVACGCNPVVVVSPEDDVHAVTSRTKLAVRIDMRLIAGMLPENLCQVQRPALVY